MSVKQEVKEECEEGVGEAVSDTEAYFGSEAALSDAEKEAELQAMQERLERVRSRGGRELGEGEVVKEASSWKCRVLQRDPHPVHSPLSGTSVDALDSTALD